MYTLIFTGAAGSTALAASATAALIAEAGIPTLLASIGPAHGAAALAATPPAPQPQPIAPNLDLWTLDTPGDLAALWGRIRPSLPAAIQEINGDELPIIPGSDLFLGVSRLHEMAARGYRLICADVGPPEALLRALSVPDTFRWVLRLALGLDRGPGKSPTSVGRALLPGSLMPFEWVGQLQDARVSLQKLRDESVDPLRSQVRYVLRPDKAGIDEALLAIPALQLFGLAVESVIAGPLLPALGGLAELAAEQEAVIAQAAGTWAPRHIHRLPAVPTPGTLGALALLGDRLYEDLSAMPGASPEPPILLSGPPDPHVSMSLPGLRRDLLGLTLSGDELIVRAGPYRRHILMPDGLRGTANIKAMRQGERLLVRAR